MTTEISEAFYENGGEHNRNVLQHVAMSAIYDVLVSVHMKEPVDVHSIVEGLLNSPYEECDYFVKAATLMAVKHYDEVIATFTPWLRKWTFDRLQRVEQAILFLSYLHFYYIDPEVEKAVVINIAVKLAKTYLNEDKDYKFVNAILDNVLDPSKR